MTTKNITIAISGESATGKSTLAYLIKSTLEQYGVKVNPINDADYKNEDDFEYKIGTNFEELIDAVAEKTKVTIVQSQVTRASQENG